MRNSILRNASSDWFGNGGVAIFMLSVLSACSDKPGSGTQPYQSTTTSETTASTTSGIPSAPATTTTPANPPVTPPTSGVPSTSTPPVTPPVTPSNPPVSPSVTPTQTTSDETPSSEPTTVSEGTETGGNGGVSSSPEMRSDSATAICPTTAMQPGDSKQSVTVGSLNRSYNLHVPTGYTGDAPLALVIDFHPLGSTGASWGGQSGWKRKADSAGFLVVHPESYNSNNSWNVGMCCQDAQQNEIDDVAFTRAIIEHVATLACVDAKRVYATGCSNGGGMTYKVACDLADVIAAAAPVDFRCVYGGSTDSPSCEGCQPSRPISITHFDNTGDNQLVPYNGGMTSFAADCPPGQSCTGMGFPSAADNFTTWQDINGCTGTTSPIGGRASCNSNGACEGGVQTTMCIQQGGSHCGNYGSLQIVDTAWEMFENQTL